MSIEDAFEKMDEAFEEMNKVFRKEKKKPDPLQAYKDQLVREIDLEIAKKHTRHHEDNCPRKYANPLQPCTCRNRYKREYIVALRKVKKLIRESKE